MLLFLWQTPRKRKKSRLKLTLILVRSAGECLYRTRLWHARDFPSDALAFSQCCSSQNDEIAIISNGNVAHTFVYSPRERVFTPIPKDTTQKFIEGM